MNKDDYIVLELKRLLEEHKREIERKMEYLEKKIDRNTLKIIDEVADVYNTVKSID
jgi:hypothetical protein